MDANRQPSQFSQSDVRRVLESKEGQQLLRQMYAEGGTALDQAAEAAKAGNYAKALSLLQPVIGTSGSAQLLKELQKKLG